MGVGGFDGTGYTIPGTDKRIVGNSEQMRAVYARIDHFLPASRDLPVLITGETGTGKELVAQAFNAPGSSEKFIPVNCASLTGELLHDALFGHARGAYTGATQSREGFARIAEGGTLFLDEIGDMPISTQASLLRFLDNREVMPLGTDRPMQVDVRMVAATNQDLDTLVQQGKFRQDLRHRLTALTLDLPPLRERGNDIPLLADHFLHACGGPNAAFERAMYGLLAAYSWPGNVRELRNTLAQAVALSDGNPIGRPHLGLPVLNPRAGVVSWDAEGVLPITLSEVLLLPGSHDRNHIRRVMRTHPDVRYVSAQHDGREYSLMFIGPTPAQELFHDVNAGGYAEFMQRLEQRKFSARESFWPYTYQALLKEPGTFREHSSMMKALTRSGIPVLNQPEHRPRWYYLTPENCGEVIPHYIPDRGRRSAMLGETILRQHAELFLGKRASALHRYETSTMS